MAYMNQEKKQRLATEIKKVVPKDWKYSLRVRNHSTLVMTVTQAPVDVVGIARASHEARNDRIRPEYDPYQGGNVDVNPYHYERQFSADPKFAETLGNILGAMNVGNHDRSDIQTDYFDVGWYVEVTFGKWDKPFINTKA